MGRATLHCAVCAAATVLTACANFEPPRDVALEAHFLVMRATLDSLVALDFANTAFLDSVGGPDKVSYWDPAVQRQRDLRSALLHRAGLRGGEGVSLRDSTVYVSAWRGWGEEKGFAYCARPPKRLEGSLDTRRALGRSAAKNVDYHRHLEGRWYLYRGGLRGS